MEFLKTIEEIEIMKAGGKITARVLREVLDSVKPGVKLQDLDKKAEELILSLGAQPSFKMVKGYNFATCININEGVVHGIPSERVIKEGDVVSVDLGAYYKGFHTDSAWTIVASGEESVNSEKKKFLETGKQALERAIKQCKPLNKVSGISRAIQETVEGAGYSVVRDLVGHGVGRFLHEPPGIPGFLRGGKDIELEEGMTLAVEVIYNRGGGSVVTDKKDGWTISSRDGSIAALYEHTIALTKRGPIVLTQR